MRDEPAGERVANLLDESGLAALRALLGRRPGPLITRSVDVLWGRVHSHSFSIQLERGRYVNVSSDWEGDTSREHLDVHALEASVDATPPDVAADWNGHLVHPYSTVALRRPGAAPAALVSIAVHMRHEGGATDEVRYDAGLVFRFEDGACFSLTTVDSILGGLIYAPGGLRADGRHSDTTPRVMLR